MSEWGVALIAAGSALAGSLVTGWYARGAGLRQAEAARHAGDRQADALLESVRITIRAEATQRALTERRRIYAEFLSAAETVILTERTGQGHPDDAAHLQRALAAVLLEGPPDVAASAQALLDALRRHASLDDLQRAKSAFVTAAQHATPHPAPPSE
ncbi:hypothetical protein IAG44_17580 [Streptomyces roseirectus]|uniref:Uncharacterized protein n=1 Tax=Streptomyces roseirectus TaxID=2768066 RepID=A0A7H0IE51_9ACTN|nr:hypothetical protein [Streptomyces roseirectus]QNP71067.1 hypothetical protein IAG44_17580 [Streptomyces roseirectus]